MIKNDCMLLHPAERPTFIRRPINQVVLEEELVEFRCQVQGDPQPNVRWRKDDVDVPRGRFVLSHERSQKYTNLETDQLSFYLSVLTSGAQTQNI